MMPVLKKCFDKYDVFIVDMDGVIWRGNEPIKDAIESLNHLIQMGKRVLFMTNNSTRTRLSYLRRLKRFGVIVDSVDSIITSAYATSLLLKSLGKRNVYVVGEYGLIYELAQQGIHVLNEDESINDNVEAVVVGLDRNLTYRKLMYALMAIRRGALFIATNTDSTLPTPEGEIPGAGAIVAAIRTASNKEPDYIVGKPNKLMVELALGSNYNKYQILVIGDRLDTDLELAYNCSADSLIVLTGVTDREDIARYHRKPTYVLSTLREMFISQ
ncbi:MAG: haloacid dehalogenase [Thermoprotei archaeon]|nr:MAG: haloacid dehalogenase [Thermoprotei archaeon]